MAETSQLTLSVQLPDDETFNSFIIGDNIVAIEQLKSFIKSNLGDNDPNSLYLYGSSGVGKSHLLHGSCSFAEQENKSIILMSFAELKQLEPRVLDGLEQYALVCLDDVQLIAGDNNWQQAVFDLFNRVIEQGSKIILTGNESAKNLGVTLPDLVSRLSWGFNVSIKPLSDDDKIQALQYRAKQRGMELNFDAAKFLVNRLARDMRTLIEGLDKLDKASIREQRKLTIPFIKSVLLDE